MCLQASSEGTAISPMEARSSPRFVQHEYIHVPTVAAIYYRQPFSS